MAVLDFASRYVYIHFNLLFLKRFFLLMQRLTLSHFFVFFMMQNNCTALHIAVTYGHAKTVKTLLSGKANVHAVNDVSPDMSLCIDLSVCMSVSVSVCMSVCLSVYLPECLRVSLSVRLTVGLSGCLSIYLSVSKSFSQRTS